MQSARRLTRRAFREREGLFLLEGPRTIVDAIDAGARLRDVFVSEESEVVEKAQGSGARIHDVSQQILRVLSDTVTPQGIVAVAELPNRSLDDIRIEAGLVLVVCEIRDPGNAGTLIRSAAGAGCDAVVFTTGSVDPYGPKTLRAAAGAVFRTTLVTGVGLADCLRHLGASGLALVGADARAERSIYDIDLSLPTAVVVGNEAWGLGAEDADQLDDVAGIPMPGGTESLNVGVAGSLFLFEAVRRRQLGSATS